MRKFRKRVTIAEQTAAHVAGFGMVDVSWLRDAIAVVQGKARTAPTAKLDAQLQEYIVKIHQEMRHFPVGTPEHTRAWNLVASAVTAASFTAELERRSNG